MIPFDPSFWQGMSLDSIYEVSGDVRIRADRAVFLYATSQYIEGGNTVWVPVGNSTLFDIQVPAGTIIKVVATSASPTLAFRYVEPVTTFAEPVDEEVYTNIDRMPDESGQVLEVRRAMREFQLLQQALLAEVRAERDAALNPDPEPTIPAPTE